MPGQRSTFAVLARLLIHPSILVIYATWAVALLAFPSGLRFRMATILGASAFGAWQLAEGLIDLARYRLALLNYGRVAIGLGLSLNALARYSQWFVVELLSNGICLVGILMLVRATTDATDTDGTMSGT